MRVGDLDALEKALECRCNKSWDGALDFGQIKEVIDNTPPVPQVTVFTETADEKAVADLKSELQNVIESRPKGEWINREAISNTIFPFWERYECNQCHKFNGYSNFCPNCGADMRGGVE